MSQQVDRVNFGLTVAVLLGMSVPLLTFPEQSAALLRAAYAWIADTFGWFYILTGAVALAVVLYVGLSRFGQIKLGEGEPEFSTPSWISMLFAAGIGAGLMYWSGIEWAYYIQNPPFSRRTLFSRGLSVGVVLRVASLGVCGMGAVLFADLGDCLSLLCATCTATQIQSVRPVLVKRAGGVATRAINGHLFYGGFDRRCG